MVTNGERSKCFNILSTFIKCKCEKSYLICELLGKRSEELRNRVVCGGWRWWWWSCVLICKIKNIQHYFMWPRTIQFIFLRHRLNNSVSSLCFSLNFYRTSAVLRKKLQILTTWYGLKKAHFNTANKFWKILNINYTSITPPNRSDSKKT